MILLKRFAEAQPGPQGSGLLFCCANTHAGIRPCEEASSGTQAECASVIDSSLGVGLRSVLKLSSKSLTGEFLALRENRYVSISNEADICASEPFL